MSDVETVYDRGLQPERTLLAWRRTCLSFATVSLVAMRFVVESLGVIGVIASTAAAGLALAACFAASHGYRRAHASLHANDRLDHGATAHALAAAAVLAIGLTCGAYIVLGAI